MMWIPALGIYVVTAIDKYTWTTHSCGGKGTAGPLSQEESTPNPCLDRLLFFSGPITLRTILIYYAQVPLGGYR